MYICIYIYTYVYVMVATIQLQLIHFPFTFSTPQGHHGLVGDENMYLEPYYRGIWYCGGWDCKLKVLFYGWWCNRKVLRWVGSGWRICSNGSTWEWAQPISGYHFVLILLEIAFNCIQWRQLKNQGNREVSPRISVHGGKLDITQGW